MVNSYQDKIRWSWITLVAWLLLLLPQDILAIPLQVEVLSTDTPPVVELGKPFEVVISTPNLSSSLENIDLSPLKPGFRVHFLGDVTVNKERSRQSLTLKLYPTKTGTQTLPSLFFHGGASTPVTIEVKAPVDQKSGEEFNVKTMLSHNLLWNKQQATVLFSLESRKAIVSLELPNHANVPFASVIALQPVTEAFRKNNQQYFRHTIGWAIYPQQPGQFSLELPAIRYIRDGVTTHRFYPPAYSISVKPLPVYIPATMPVGKLHIENVKTDDHLTITHQLNNLHLQVSSHGLSQPIVALQHQLHSDDNINFYPVQAESHQEVDGKGMQNQVTFDIPFKVMSQGTLTLPTLSLQYFDPQDGTIRNQQVSLGNIVAVSKVTLVFLGLLTFIILLWLTRQLAHWLKYKWQHFNNYRTILMDTRKASSPEDIKLMLMKIAKTENWPSNLTLRQWQDCYQQQRYSMPGLDFHVLEKALYTGTCIELEKLQESIKKLCLERWQVLRWVG